jgi:hypothetical protein
MLITYDTPILATDPTLRRQAAHNVELDVAGGGGLQAARYLDLGATGVLVVSGASRLYGLYVANRAAAMRYLKVYNTFSAPQVGTDTPAVTIGLLPTSALQAVLFQGASFSLGIGLAATTGPDDADTGPPAANDVVANVFYAEV